MAFQKITENVSIHQSLPDNPNLTSQQLKKKWDEASEIIKTNFNKLIDELNNNMYPIGTGFISYTSVDYTNHLGFKWEKTCIGRTPVGLDTNQTEFNTIGKTGGEKTHKLSIDELAEHNHEGLYTDVTGMDHIYVSSGSSHRVPTCDHGSSSVNKGIHTGNAGRNKSHNNLQPYQVVVFWKRVA